MNITSFLKDRRARGMARSPKARELAKMIEERWQTRVLTDSIKTDMLRDGIMKREPTTQGNALIVYMLDGDRLILEIKSTEANLDFIAVGVIGSFPQIDGNLVGFLKWTPLMPSKEEIKALIDEAERTGHMDEHEATVARLSS